MRIYDEKRRKVKPGDTIVFTNIADNTQKLRATVVKLHVFPTFAELYQNLPLPLCGYTADELPTAYFTDMERYYSAEVQFKYGVVGIELSAPEELPEEAE